jgi:hypothetical protein
LIVRLAQGGLKAADKALDKTDYAKIVLHGFGGSSQPDLESAPPNGRETSRPIAIYVQDLPIMA